jgi:16S rRNA (guanine527-N7)-methyltransferase
VEDTEVKHFLDSLTIAPVLRERGLDSARLVDVGSGAGFPGLPLKIALPGLRVALVEATGKKARFLEHVVATLGLTDVDVLSSRAELLAHDPSLRERFDVAVSRAVAELNALLELTLPFCRQGGVMVAQKKGDVAGELAAALRALDVLGGRLIEVREVTAQGLADGRVLALVEKVAPTPDKYPRRPGMPQKRPL